MTDTIETQLFCLHCHKETLHTVIYRGKYLNKIRCEECKTEIALDRKKILETCTADTIERIFTKPHRMTEEMRKDITHFMISLPIRIITKPVRLAKEFMDIVKE